MREIKEFTTFLKEVFPNPAMEEAIGTLCAGAIFRWNEIKRGIWLYEDESNSTSILTAAIQQIVPTTSFFIHELATTKPLPVQVFTTPLVVIYDDCLLTKRRRWRACRNIMNILCPHGIKDVYPRFYSPLLFRSNCRLLIISNTAPSWPEGFEIFHKWILPIEMPRRFLPGEADPDLKDSYRKSRLDTFDWICAAARKKIEKEG
jgi:hypothetical protein